MRFVLLALALFATGSRASLSITRFLAEQNDLSNSTDSACDDACTDSIENNSRYAPGVAKCDAELGSKENVSLPDALQCLCVDTNVGEPYLECFKTCGDDVGDALSLCESMRAQSNGSNTATPPNGATGTAQNNTATPPHGPTETAKKNAALPMRDAGVVGIALALVGSAAMVVL